MSRHGRATFSVLLSSDLAVVVLLILTPLISPNSSKGGGGVGLQAIAEPLGLAAVKAIVAITAIIAGGRLYRFGRFISKLRKIKMLRYSLQTRSLLFWGLVSLQLGYADVLLIGGKTILVSVAGRLFGISIISAIRDGLLLAPGGEFAFVAFGEAVNQANGCNRAEMEALHEERQRDHEELMRDREEGKSDHEEMMREREELMKQAEDGKKARKTQVQLNHLNNMVSRLTSLLQP
ncbi:unnamed protein product [Camellia sinensis]